MTWRDIETAPKDGNYILIAIATPDPIGNRVTESWWMGDKFFHTWAYAKPTHWMPLPAPPKNTE